MQSGDEMDKQWLGRPDHTESQTKSSKSREAIKGHYTTSGTAAPDPSGNGGEGGGQGGLESISAGAGSPVPLLLSEKV